jgi:hypothetical protein
MKRRGSRSKVEHYDSPQFNGTAGFLSTVHTDVCWLCESDTVSDMETAVHAASSDEEGDCAEEIEASMDAEDEEQTEQAEEQSREDEGKNSCNLKLTLVQCQHNFFLMRVTCFL